MKILIVSELSVPYAVGGGEVRYGLLARELAKRGHDVTWLSMRQQSSPKEEAIDGVRHVHRGPRIDSPPHRPLIAMLWYMLAAFWHVITNRYDCVDCQPYAPLPAVWLACCLSRQKMVATIHDTSSRPSGSIPGLAADDQWLSARDRFIVGPIETFLYRLPYRRIVTDTYGVRKTLAQSFGVSESRMLTVHCGIDTDAIAAAAAAAEHVDVLFAGRVIPHKHVDDFLDAVAAVGMNRRDRGLPAVQAAVVGGGPLLEEMRTRAQGLGFVPGREPAFETPVATVEFVGSLPDHAAVIGRMKSARVLVLPSTREGFGLVLAEAMACGTPCVAYDVPAVREVLADGEAGVLVPPRDVAGLAAAIDRLLTDTGERGRLIAAGRSQVEECFAADRFARGMITAYES